MSTCLIVDDSRVTRKIIRQMLEALGVECSEAEDGQKAYETCVNDGFPDLIFLDWNMPVMNGFDFMVKLRNDYPDKLPTIIFCTTQNEISQIQAALAAGASDYIMKPFDRTIIANKLEQNGFEISAIED